MKLRNKKTGKIIEWEQPITYKLGKSYYSIEELAEDWEDYEEPKGYWYVSSYGNLAKTDVMTDLHRGAEEIGNLFETKEEAEKAVEKLKAWKRLKDKGFRCKDFEETDRGELGDFTIYAHIEPDYSQKYDEFDDDLYLLFGGEE